MNYILELEWTFKSWYAINYNYWEF